MEIKFNLADENDRKAAEELFDRFSSDYNSYYAAPSSDGIGFITASTKTKMMTKRMFLYALQNISR